MALYKSDMSQDSQPADILEVPLEIKGFYNSDGREAITIDHSQYQIWNQYLRSHRIEKIL
jgi:hypothetical protein